MKTLPFHPAVADWFRSSFGRPTRAQELGWPPIARGESTLILAPTGTGKTLAAFLSCIDRILFGPPARSPRGCRVVYVSPLKALVVDVERNLRGPIVGISHAAQGRGIPHGVPRIAIRTGDTPPRERALFRRQGADILVTTPESLYLLVTSAAREVLSSVETVIVDEVHALVPTKRGAHLALTLERLQALCPRPFQRIGLSATARPVEEVARFLGGAEPRAIPKERRRVRAAAPSPKEDLEGEFSGARAGVRYRSVSVVETGERKPLDLRIEVAVEDMARIGELGEAPIGPADQGPVRRSIWTAVHPKVLDLIRQHRTTLVFVNSRRLAERMAAALNDLAGEILVHAHHGSLALDQRREVENELKAGQIRGLVATSSLELGIDMSAVDLVIQIEAPPSVASGVQRIGRGSHQVGATSRGIVFPKYRADLLACAAAAEAMQEGRVEATRYPRNPLDVLAQQLSAMISLEDWRVDDLFATVRSAAPFALLGRPAFEGVLDMLSGVYPSDDFAELKPRVTWDRMKDIVTAREGTRRLAVVNAGTIPDRGLYGVFLAGAAKGAARVGELDEEMVFESRAGETFLLGASTWRIEEITNDRVLVSPAPGEPGKMPFWKGDGVGRPVELGERIGQTVRTLRAMPEAAALSRLMEGHRLDRNAAENLLRYLADQAAATGVVPDDRTALVERCRDELGDWRLCVLTPFGSRVHAPWAMAVTARILDRTGISVEAMWTDDGFVLRYPDTEEPLDTDVFLPSPREARDLVIRQLGNTSLFAGRFREAAARALLLPRRRPGARTPLWRQRKRAADLLAVASRFGSFPMILEAYRECLRDVFDMPALLGILGRIREGSIRVESVESAVPSPFASALLFGYVANYIYDGDAPLAERRAQALSIDQTQLRELLGDADLRELLDAASLQDVEEQLQSRAEGYRVKTPDGIHDLLRRLGALSEGEVVDRSATAAARTALPELVASSRAVAIPLGGETRFIAAEDAGRYRDALGVPLPQGLPEAFLEASLDALLGVVRRYARTHGPFTTAEIALRLGLAPSVVEAPLQQLARSGSLLEGEFRPGGVHREWCDAEILRSIRRRSLARVRKEVEPADTRTLGRLLSRWHGVVEPRARSLDAVLDVVETLQGAALPASALESRILPARIADYSPADLDALLLEGEVVWCGVEPLGDHDGRMSLFLADALPRLFGPGTDRAGGPPLSARAQAVVAALGQRGASFFASIHQAAGGGYPGETVDALWELVWSGLVTNDSLQPLRALTRGGTPAGWGGRRYRSRRLAPPTAQGRWSLVASRLAPKASATEHLVALAQQLLRRYGLLTREAVAAEGVPGGFSALYPILKSMEESGRIRRGYFVSGVGAAQFAMPAALDLLRSLREPSEAPEVVRLAAVDPASPYGTVLPWPPDPRPEGGAPGPAHSPGRGGLEGPPPGRFADAEVLLLGGALGAYYRSGSTQLRLFVHEADPEWPAAARALAGALASRGGVALRPGARDRRGGLLIDWVNGKKAAGHPLAPFLEGAGFVRTGDGLQLRRGLAPSAAS